VKAAQDKKTDPLALATDQNAVRKKSENDESMEQGSTQMKTLHPTTIEKPSKIRNLVAG